MKIYWTLKSIPELSQLSWAERGKVWRRTSLKTLRHWQTWAGGIACGVVAGLGQAIGSRLEHSYIGAVIGSCIGGFIVSQTMIGVARHFYKDILLAKDDLDIAIEQNRKEIGAGDYEVETAAQHSARLKAMLKDKA